eukprot:CAMPEP_0119470306 /NCGR_PEP_ID=MMETSP1344-20130328/3263_1 /TAXON_ID=236787 /ORGANISM="Florenciella parvula, Strain CCMP2471" /LENGTH=79 /DNA_ID=CAMNT_0007502961 /DNA_START=442 /DNA_END=678 /DNA_ORIENTATION=+
MKKGFEALLGRPQIGEKAVAQHFTMVPSLGRGARRKWPNLVLRRIKSALRVASGTGEARAPLASPGQRGSRLVKPWWPR